MQRDGQYPVPPQAGKILGVEFAGWIEELGDQTENSFKVGEKVCGWASGGQTFALSVFFETNF